MRAVTVLRPFAVLLALAAAAAFAPAFAETDAPGTRDHPMVKRYEGSWILGYQQREYTEFTIATGPLKVDYSNQAQPYSVERSVKPEGKHTRVLYVVPVKRSTLEVMRNYAEDLEVKGFKRLFSCSGAECGADNGNRLITHWIYPIASGQKLKNKGQMSEYALNFPEDMRYAVYWLERPTGSVYVALAIAENKFNQWPETFDKTMVLMDVVEVGQMERRMTDPKADEMKRSLDKERQGLALRHPVRFQQGRGQARLRRYARRDRGAAQGQSGPEALRRRPHRRGGCGRLQQRPLREARGGSRPVARVQGRHRPRPPRPRRRRPAGAGGDECDRRGQGEEPARGAGGAAVGAAPRARSSPPQPSNAARSSNASTGAPAGSAP